MYLFMYDTVLVSYLYNITSLKLFVFFPFFFLSERFFFLFSDQGTHLPKEMVVVVVMMM